MIYTSSYHSPVGWLHVSCNNDSVTSVLFAENAGDKSNDDHPLVSQCIFQLDEYFRGKRTSFDLPMQQEGTPFQLSVWKLLQSISFGKTISYHQLAVEYGDSKAIRAVAAANG